MTLLHMSSTDTQTRNSVPPDNVGSDKASAFVDMDCVQDAILLR